MVNAQEWLDKNYTKEERKLVSDIHLTEPSLEGELDLKDFTFLVPRVFPLRGVKIYVYPQVDETKLTFKNLPEGAKVFENSWIGIHKNFGDYWNGEECQKLWINYDFNYQTTKEWKEVLGEWFSINDFAFCTWLRDEKHLTPQVVKQQGSAKNLRTKYNKLWTDIHKDFSKKNCKVVYNCLI